MKRLLLDQGVPRDAGVILRLAGWDVVHVGEVGLAAAEDGDILEWARAESRVCVTLDGDFHASLGERAPPARAPFLILPAGNAQK